eukprot:scaffold82393_cov50-Prasinocladus_malaysianus.AAC.2
MSARPDGGRLATQVLVSGDTHLDGLAEPHLVGEDAVEVVVVEGDHPREAQHLVLPQAAVVGRLKQAGLAQHLLLDAVGQRVVPRLGVPHLLIGLRRLARVDAQTQATPITLSHANLQIMHV